MSIKDLFKNPDLNENTQTTSPKINNIDKKSTPYKEEKYAHRSETRSKPGERYTENELMVRLKFIIGVCLALTLIGIVFTVLYSIMFVTQPLNAISPIDQKFFELIIPVATFLCGTLSGIMLAGSGKEAAMAGAAAQANAMNGQNKSIGLHTRPIGPSPISMSDSQMRDTNISNDFMPNNNFSSSPSSSGSRPIGKPAIKPISLD